MSRLSIHISSIFILGLLRSGILEVFSDKVYLDGVKEKLTFISFYYPSSDSLRNMSMDIRL